jgi:tetratricopeptide (TPR) repeat protein
MRKSSAQQVNSHRFRILVSLACLIFALSMSLDAQTSVPAPLPPAAQEALNKGFIAAKVPDYLLAIRYFEDARKIAPDAPIIYFNLALAESKIPGRELRAIALFGAYLAAIPTAPNAAAVKEQIDILYIRSQSNTSRLIKQVQDAANQTPNYRTPHLLDVVVLWAKAGDIAQALKTADLVQDDRNNGPYKGIAQFYIAEAQSKNGDIAGAQKTANLIQDEGWKGRAQKAMAEAQARVGITDAPNSPRQSTSATKTDSQPDIRVHNWLYKRDDILNTEPFLDLAGYLKSMPDIELAARARTAAALGAAAAETLDGKSLPSDIPHDNPEKVFFFLRETAKKIVEAQNVIDQMLKQQSTKR